MSEDLQIWTRVGRYGKMRYYATQTIAMYPQRVTIPELVLQPG